jgi:hypothetical protein
MTRFSMFVIAIATLTLLIVANSQTRKPRPPINRPPVTETQTDDQTRASHPRVSFRCVQSPATSSLILKVRNNGPDRLNADTTVYYYYRTPDSDMSVTGSHRVAGRLDKGAVFTIDAGGNHQSEITECGCALRPFTPVARTTRKASQ